MAGRIAKTDGQPTVWQLLPIKVVASGLVCRLIPTGNLKAYQSRRTLRKQTLLDRTSDVQIMLYKFKFALQFCFAERCVHVTSNLACDDCRSNATRQYQACIDQISKRNSE